MLFFFYLKRMLRALDPSRAVPQRVRAAYDTLTEGLLVVDRQGMIVLANKSTGLMLGVPESRLVGRSPSEFGWSRAGEGAMDMGRSARAATTTRLSMLAGLSPRT